MNKLLYLVPIENNDNDSNIIQCEKEELKLVHTFGVFVCLDVPFENISISKTASTNLSYKTITINGINYLKLYDSYEELVHDFGKNTPIALMCIEHAKQLINTNDKYDDILLGHKYAKVIRDFL